MARPGGADGREPGGPVWCKNGPFRWFWLVLVLVSAAEPVTTQRSLGAESGTTPRESGSVDPLNVSTTMYDDERFQVASFDWDRVQTPMLLGLTLLACALTKLGESFLRQS
ncbi:hypothetical protein LSH36_101g05035 [Paralvinella palmiformis]|uniref:Uncharacterized protein n=1 Tax=Paralvinella palmiformis TaxID=53620 RepID=A0AAD9K0R1_9ANNE|nr:hypothetical protein LSH36_101g05035 [Paralvinella palmiformis]